MTVDNSSLSFSGFIVVADWCTANCCIFFLFFLRTRLHTLHSGQRHGDLSLLPNGCLGDHTPLSQPRLPQITPPLPSPDSLEKLLFDRGGLEDPNHHPDQSHSRAQAAQPDPGCTGHTQASVEAGGLGVHEEEVSFSERLDLPGAGETHGEGGDTCGQSQDAHGHRHLGGDRRRVSMTDLG